ncbi:DNA translocase FtsK [Kushneria konosiri]|uniref:DNA translocase FtsK 4TM region domain-containing protein n=1 Tax=Kushneria konosiri TaxID=698828 RepID=A0A2Z2HEB2_9GAMM|nr:DNA translocase FtsK [Kushneria konosiri]ARS51621.1 hypothetical protein B9G99_00905 [Kushneria konosiri]
MSASKTRQSQSQSQARRSKSGASPRTTRKSATTQRSRQRVTKARDNARHFSARLQGAAKEGVAIVMLALCAFLLLALFSYVPADPSWSHSGPDQQVTNWMGPVGAWLSDVLYSLFGASALWAPGMLGLGAWRLIRAKEAHVVWDPMALAVRGGGLLLVMVATCNVGALHFQDASNDLPYGSGGIVGEGISAALASLVGRHGTTLLSLAAFLCGMPLLTGMSWFSIIDEVGNGIWRGVRWCARRVGMAGASIGSAGSRLQERRREMAQERREAYLAAQEEDEFDFGHDDDDVDTDLRADAEDARPRRERSGLLARFMPGRRAPAHDDEFLEDDEEPVAPTRQQGGDRDADDMPEQISGMRTGDDDIPWEQPYEEAPKARESHRDNRTTIDPMLSTSETVPESDQASKTHNTDAPVSPERQTADVERHDARTDAGTANASAPSITSAAVSSQVPKERGDVLSSRAAPIEEPLVRPVTSDEETSSAASGNMASSAPADETPAQAQPSSPPVGTPQDAEAPRAEHAPGDVTRRRIPEVIPEPRLAEDDEDGFESPVTPAFERPESAMRQQSGSSTNASAESDVPASTASGEPTTDDDMPLSATEPSNERDMPLVDDLQAAPRPVLSWEDDEPEFSTPLSARDEAEPSSSAPSASALTFEEDENDRQDVAPAAPASESSVTAPSTPAARETPVPSGPSHHGEDRAVTPPVAPPDQGGQQAVRRLQHAPSRK